MYPTIHVIFTGLLPPCRFRMEPIRVPVVAHGLAFLLFLPSSRLSLKIWRFLECLHRVRDCWRCIVTKGGGRRRCCSCQLKSPATYIDSARMRVRKILPSSFFLLAPQSRPRPLSISFFFLFLCSRPRWGLLVV